ncbi:MAG: hypothetical protein HY785_28085 [Oscillatoriophycideae cyanobacterium NC_groundwater_1537_Pr4_S-0.65um_50_18]|nr:hypothetical protein [Oscillatoriophycideae cyanobacterium NC_groundwater_1537_Pr4_S-0.65um_50_18]
MWHRLKNYLSSLWTYNVLSPDLRVRRRVKRSLHHRPALTPDEWFTVHYKQQDIAPVIAAFAYEHLEQYSGLTIGKVLPSDRLEEDLHWTQICWFDWELSLCEDFYDCFEVDISDRLDVSCLSTLQDLMDFLNQNRTDPHLDRLDQLDQLDKQEQTG